MEVEDIRKIDSIKMRRRMLKSLIEQKLRYYEKELAKSADPVLCDDVDWIVLCSDMFDLIEEFKNTIYYEF